MWILIKHDLTVNFARVKKLSAYDRYDRFHVYAQFVDGEVKLLDSAPTKQAADYDIAEFDEIQKLYCYTPQNIKLGDVYSNDVNYIKADNGKFAAYFGKQIVQFDYDGYLINLICKLNGVC